MEINRIEKASFVVIGKEGSTRDGVGFVDKLWNKMYKDFKQIRHLAKKDEEGNLVGIWGAMSDFKRTFKPWENDFSKGLYLAGVECKDDAQAPKGWVKWVIPAYEYVVVEVEDEETFSDVIYYLEEEEIELVGSVHDFVDPESGKNYMYFPVKKL